MKSTVLLLAAILSLSACQTKESENRSNEQYDATAKQEIEALLFAYRDALNASDVSAVLALYTENGVFMPSGVPSSIGKEQVKGAYEFAFSNIELSLEFFVDEIVINGEYAYARTNSKGSTLILATGETVPAENTELFVLQKEKGSWKIDRYMYNKMK